MKETSGMQRILVLSPHLDDAVLSCSDHIMDWRKKAQVLVVTIFTRFGNKSSIFRHNNRLSESGFSSPQEQEEKRKKEDELAITKLKVDFLHLDFVDAGYRTFREKPLYPGSSLFSGKVSHNDGLLAPKLEKALKPFKEFDRVVIPLGVGGHIDHVLTRKAARKIFDKNQTIYYVDYPYALKLRNWSLAGVLKLISKRKSIKPMSDKKREILEIYASQIPLLFSKKISNYPEIILT